MSRIREMLLFILIILLAWLGFLVVKPFLSFVLLGFLFAFLFFPIYKLLRKIMWNNLAALLVVGIVLMCIIVPAVYLAGAVLAQAGNAYQSFESSGVSILDETSIANAVEQWTGLAVHDAVIDLFAQGREVLKSAIPSIITGTGIFLIGLFILFFILFFALQEGPAWFERASGWLPIPKKKREHSMKLLKRQAKALIYGQILTSILVGIVVGGILWAFDIPNAVFWAFVTIILGIIPVVGAFLIYIPAGLYLISQGSWVGGLVLIAISIAAHLSIDNILRPKLVSKASEIHPILVVLGALGGIILMGIVGFLIGPLILSFFFILMDEMRTT